ncbi:hypothetical protein ACQ4PT_041179 [Festuca glaucescens]
MRLASWPPRMMERVGPEDKRWKRERKDDVPCFTVVDGEARRRHPVFGPQPLPRTVPRTLMAGRLGCYLHPGLSAAYLFVPFSRIRQKRGGDKAARRRARRRRRLQMNQAEVSDLVCAGLHDTNAGEQSYATECPEMNQDPSRETIKFEVSMATPAMHSVFSNSNACLDGHQHTGIMAGRSQAVEEVKFGIMQHLEGRVSDSDEESLSSSPETSDYSYMEQNMENIYNTLGEMDDKEGPVMLIPEFVLCDTALHLQPHLTFSSDGFKIEHFDCDSREDEMISLYWDVCDIICINSKWTQSVKSASITLTVRSSAETKCPGPIRVEFCLTDPQWPQKQEKICCLASRYHEIWNTTPPEDIALENRSIDLSLLFPKQYFSGTEDFEEVIYPKGDRDAVSISSRDVDLLLPETFVNDTIIDFYIKYLSARIKITERCKYHFFNSFFFRKLADLDKDQGRAPEGRSAFLRVRKWTRKINIFAKDFLFIPVNFSLHWSLIVICHPGEVVTSEDDEAEKHGKVPCILHMDSLKGSHSGLKDIIQSYLWEEWKERHPESGLDISDKFLNLRFVPLELPQQDNSFDCGLFLLHYVELFLMDAPSSFNPLKLDVFSTFLSDNWFAPAEASLKRSLIRKLIHKLVTEPSQNFPELTCAADQFDERHQRSENAEQEAAIEFLALGFSAGESDSVCQIPGAQQESTSICFNSPGKGLPVSGFGLETADDTMFAVQDMQICPPDNDTVVCLPSQGVKNDPTLPDSDNQCGLRSCAPEGAEVLKDDGCVVKDRDTYEESVLDYLHNNKEISSQTEAMVHDTMDSKCCSFSDNPDVMACKQHSLETSTNEVVDGSEDMHSVMMSDASKDDIANDPASTKGEAENGMCDLPDVGIAIGDINGNASGCSLERSVVKVEEAIGDISDDTGSVVNKDVPEHSLATNAVESEYMEPEDTHGDVKVEDDIQVNTNETYTAVDEIKGNTDKCMTSDEAVSCESKEGKTNNILAGDSDSGRDEAHPDSAGSHVAVPCEDVTTRADAEMTSLENTSCAENETVREDKDRDAKRPLPDSTSEVKNIQVSEDKCSEEDAPCTEEKQERLDAKRPLPDSTSEVKNIQVSEDKCSEEDAPCTEEKQERLDAKRPLPDSTSEVKNIQVSEDKCSEEDAPCTEEKQERLDAKRPLPDSTSEVKNIQVSEDKCSEEDAPCTEDKQERLDAKRPLPDSTSEVKNIQVSEDKCSEEDAPCTEEKQERRRKRRKVVVSGPAEKRRTRSSSRTPSLD